MFLKNYKHTHFGYQFFGCILPKKKSYHNKLKTILHLPITDITKRTHVMQLWTFCKTKNMYNTACLLYDIYMYSQHTYVSINIHIIITCACVTILTHVQFLHELQAVHQHMYLFVKKYKNVYFWYQLLWVNVAHEHIIWETLKKYITSSRNWNFLYFIDTSILSTPNNVLYRYI